MPIDDETALLTGVGFISTLSPLVNLSPTEPKLPPTTVFVRILLASSSSPLVFITDPHSAQLTNNQRVTRNRLRLFRSSLQLVAAFTYSKQFTILLYSKY